MKLNDETLCKYVEDWMQGHYENWKIAYYGILKDKRTGIYNISNGYKWLDTLDGIMGNIEDRMYLLEGEHLVPARFSSPHQFLHFLKWFGEYAKIQKQLYNKLKEEEKSDYDVCCIMQMLDDIVEMTDYCLKSYSVDIVDDTYLKPYLDMKACLEEEDVDEFVAIIANIFCGIPYNIHKKQLSEAYFHSITYALMYQLGFNVIAECETSDGRMDMVMEMDRLTYIFEFKFSKEDKDMSENAVEQIVRNGYGKRYQHKGKKVIGVGVSFGGKSKTVNGMNKVILS